MPGRCRAGTTCSLPAFLRFSSSASASGTLTGSGRRLWSTYEKPVLVRGNRHRAVTLRFDLLLEQTIDARIQEGMRRKKQCFHVEPLEKLAALSAIDGL